MANMQKCSWDSFYERISHSHKKQFTPNFNILQVIFFDHSHKTSSHAFVSYNCTVFHRPCWNWNTWVGKAAHWMNCGCKMNNDRIVKLNTNRLLRWLLFRFRLLAVPLYFLLPLSHKRVHFTNPLTSSDLSHTEINIGMRSVCIHPPVVWAVSLIDLATNSEIRVNWGLDPIVSRVCESECVCWGGFMTPESVETVIHPMWWMRAGVKDLLGTQEFNVRVTKAYTQLAPVRRLHKKKTTTLEQLFKMAIKQSLCFKAVKW